MEERQTNIDRRRFLKTVGAAGLTGSLALSSCKAKDQDTPAEPNITEEKKQIVLPTRPFGRTGIKVPVLSLGMMFDALEKQFVLRRALQLGVTYWDTAHVYSGGNSELGVGKFLSKNPEIRKDLFIASKASMTKTIADVEKRLQTSLKRMQTDYIDLYFLHDIKGTRRLTDELRDWAAGAKKRKLIRFFGFTMHKTITECLEFGAGLDWIDAIMHSYNFRLMQDEKLNAAVDACHKAGIALIAMKTQGQGSAKKIKTGADKKVVAHFLERGFTVGQAKLKAVLADRRFANACVGRDNIKHLALNVAAAIDKTKLTQEDIDALTEYARATCSGYCAGCSRICDDALPHMPYVSDVMRYLMYYNSYGERRSARELFAQIPAGPRSRLLATDYTPAEALCPQHLPIQKLIAEAVSKLT